MSTNPAMDVAMKAKTDQLGASMRDLQAKITAAHDEVGRVCVTPRGWRMSIPVDESRDSDCIISAGLDAVEAVLAELERHRALVADLTLVRDSRLDQDEWERTRGDVAAEILARHGFGDRIAQVMVEADEAGTCIVPVPPIPGGA